MIRVTKNSKVIMMITMTAQTMNSIQRQMMMKQIKKDKRRDLWRLKIGERR